MEQTEKSPLLRGTSEEPLKALTPGTSDRLIPVKRLITVEPLLLLLISSFTASQPLFSQYIYSRVFEQHNSTSYPSQANYTGNLETIRAKSTMYSMYFNICCFAPCIFSTIFLGSYSDQAGRKIGIIPPFIGNTLKSILDLLIVIWQLPLPLFCIGSVISGISGGNTSVMMSCYAYLADVTSLAQRSRRIVIAQIVFLIGAVVTQLITGFLIKHAGFAISYAFVLAIYGIALLYTVFILPESLKRAQDTCFFTMSHFSDVLKVYTKNSTPGRRQTLISCLCILTIGTCIIVATSETITFYFLGRPFYWNAVEIGYYLSYFVGVKGVGSFLFIVLLLRKLGDHKSLIIGAISGVSFYIALALASDDMTAFIAPALAVGLGLVDSLPRSIASKEVQPEEQGRLSASIFMFTPITLLLTIAASNTLYAYTLHFIHGFIYYILAGGYLIILLLAIFILVLGKRISNNILVLPDLHISSSSG